MDPKKRSFEMTLLSRKALEIVELVPIEPIKWQSSTQATASGAAVSADPTASPASPARSTLTAALFGDSKKETPKTVEFKMEKKGELPNVAFHQWNNDGSLLATWSNVAPTSILSVWKPDNWTKPHRELHAISSIRSLTWGNTGKYVCVGTDNHNYEIFDIEAAKQISQFQAKPLSSEGGRPFQFGQNDSYFVRIVSTGLTVTDMRHGNVANEHFRFDANKIFAFEVAPVRSDGQLFIAIFAKGFKGSPPHLKILSVHLGTKEIRQICQKMTYQVQNAEFLWNSTGEYVLAKTHVEVDESGKSYYGKSALFLMPAKRDDLVSQIVTHEQGPVNAYSWSRADPNLFTVISGPITEIRVAVLNAAQNGKLALNLGAGKRNTLIPSPTGDLLLSAGFGNLPGDIDVWDIKKKKIIGMNRISWVVDCEWTPDAYWLICSTTTPRLRVDNGIRIVRCNGDLVFKHDVEELYKVSLRPTAATVPRRALSPKRKPAAPAASGQLTTAIDHTGVVGGGVSSLPPGVGGIPQDAGDKKKKKTSGKASDTVVSQAPVELEFTLEEAAVSTRTFQPTATEAVAPIREPAADKANELKATLEVMDEAEIIKRLGKLRKMEAECQALIGKKKLDANQRNKRDKLPGIQTELKLVLEVCASKGIGLD